MIKKQAIIMAFAATCSLAACNSSDTEYHEAELDGSAIVKGFSLVENNKILADLDSVFFSIDLVAGEIFNADSLPKDTRINGLAANITTDNASAVTLYIPRVGKEDSVVNYLEHSSDTIDFSNGPVRLEVTSLSGLNKKTYRISVNVHNVVSDSLCWGSSAYTALPVPGNATAQRTVLKDGTAYTFSTDGTGYVVGATGDYAAWNAETFTPGFDMNISSITAGADGFYALAADGTLYHAATAAGPWSATNARFHALYGSLGSCLIGCTRTGDSYAIDTYPSVNHVIAMPKGMPVEAFSPAVTLTAGSSSSPQLVITGGRRADGSLNPDSYGFDGRNWAKLSAKGLPEGLEAPAVAPYYSLRATNITWRPEVYPTLLSFGGRKADGTVNRIVYMSRDWGMHWQKADSLLQPAPEMPCVYNAQAIVADKTLSISRASAWREFGAVRLPLGARLESASAGRATAPITEWDAPYIYLFGGHNADGSLNDAIWRGVITRFTFKPIQ